MDRHFSALTLELGFLDLPSLVTALIYLDTNFKLSGDNFHHTLKSLIYDTHLARIEHRTMNHIKMWLMLNSEQAAVLFGNASWSLIIMIGLFQQHGERLW